MDISAVAMTGPYLAIGVKGFLGELITTYFINIYEEQHIQKLSYQKTKISKLAVSPNGKYLLSLGESDSKMYFTLLKQTGLLHNKHTARFYHRHKDLFPKNS